MAQLRPYQTELLQRVLHALETDDRKRVMMQLPTGGGKTVIAGALLAHWLKANRRAVWLTHRKELIEQTGKVLNREGVRTVIDPRWRVGAEAQARRGAAVLLMAQTTGRRAAEGNVWGGYDPDDLMVIDEAHHSSANGYEQAMEQWPGMVLGMTATPWRLSEQEGFDHLFSSLVRGPQIAELQSEGALCKSRVLVPSAEQRIIGGRPGQIGDYTPSGIVRANAGPRRVMTAEAVNLWKQYAADRPTIAYAVSQEHAHNLQAFFQSNGIRAEVILSDTHRERRGAAIAGFKQGYVRVLINVLVATEGFDLPDASCVMMARPTLSLSLYLQMVGRGLRPKPDGGDCLILDLAGNTLTHGLPEALRSWSLPPRGEQDPDETVGSMEDVKDSGGKSCGRCGRLRGWRYWEYEHHCGNAHDLVCDLCHIDAHIAARLPVDPPLTTLVVPEKHSEGLARIAEWATLVALYHATDGPNWIRKDNWLTDAPVEEWYGVTTDDNGRVSELRLFANQLSGEIPAELGKLINLTLLSLAKNHLTGEIPHELARLTELTGLGLYSNQLRGEIPRWLGRLVNLTGLGLGDNQLTGEIPRELSSVTSLTELDLGNNQLSGEIPQEMGRLVNLTGLKLAGNQLTGEIPQELGHLADLMVLNLAFNQLTGKIPGELGRLAKLTELGLIDNQLTGEIPRELGHLTNLRRLYLDANQLTGKIPRELGSLANLTELGLNGNQLTGEIPWELGYLVNLTKLELLGNQLTGEIPWALGRLVNLTRLYLDSNQLTGEIPWELGRLASLTALDLGMNELTGEIPQELGRLTNLTYLRLRDNQLTGEIPKELGGLTKLNSIYLSGNSRLTGSIPEELRTVNDNDLLKLLVEILSNPRQ